MNIHRDLKSLLSLWENLANNQRYEPYVDKVDITTVRQRVLNEGITFLTSVLPKIGKALDSFHSTFEWVAPCEFQTTLWNYNGTTYNLPLFLGKAISKAIEGDSQAVDCVRQLSLIFYKYEVDYDDQTVEKFLQKFKETDAGLSTLNYQEGCNLPLEKLIVNMRRLIARVLCNTDPYYIRPCHGGGATACQTENKDKWHKLRYFPELDAVYPYDDHFFYSPTHLIDEYQRLEDCPVGVRQARVCLVPKDSRGPRVISCEPAELMYIQQGLMSLLYETIETHHMTAGQVNFVDQKINRSLARWGSISNEYSTIDLSDASDRVSLRLVELVFPPNWVECFKACRSDTTFLPDKSVVKLNKFAPMGSACCFPVEALVFWACAEASTMSVPGYVPRSTFVYGDDIIVRSNLFDRVVEGLKLIDLMVNENKSYKAGPFRESCGGDYHYGNDVTPVRVRKPLLSSGTGLATNADLANSFIAKFGYASALPMVNSIEESVGVVYPRTTLTLPCTVRANPTASNDVFFQRRFNKDLQRFEYRILAPTLNIIRSRPPGWGELLRKELSRKPTGSSLDHLLGRDQTRDDKWIKFEHKLARAYESQLEPGQYADVHSARNKWTWTWLG